MSRLAMPYTLHDTPAIASRIDADLDLVVAETRAGDPRMRSLILTGGFARGEGAMLDGQPQNDYDFVAVRGPGRPARPYPESARRLERKLGLHVDLAPVAAWRLPFVQHSVFWYETALRGRVLWGEDVRRRIPVRNAGQLDRGEGMRLLVNRAAGLLLVTPSRDAHARRLQAAKAILAAVDAHLLAAGTFAPSQTERWREFQRRGADGRVAPLLGGDSEWPAWAFAFKVDPATAPTRDAQEAWQAGRRAILESVPLALGHAGLASLEDYARRDGWLDRAVYVRRSAGVAHVRRWAAHPTGRVRVATLRLLADAPDGHVRPQAAQACLSSVARPGAEPLVMLEGLRRATLQ